MAASMHATLLYCLGLWVLLVALSPQWQRAQADDAQLLVAEGPFTFPHHTPAPAPVPLNCTSACEFRCSKAGRPNRCLRACNTCCARCHCVPPGTAGNQEACGTCYTHQKTHDEEIKCP
ncbi:hypothetical protein L7F22_013416 [Adiantum nelumboides]|nr:hypothetical protein [Adiantum nelumboides]